MMRWTQQVHRWHQIRVSAPNCWRTEPGQAGERVLWLGRVKRSFEDKRDQSQVGDVRDELACRLSMAGFLS